MQKMLILTIIFHPYNGTTAHYEAKGLLMRFLDHAAGLLEQVISSSQSGQVTAFHKFVTVPDLSTNGNRRLYCSFLLYRYLPELYSKKQVLQEVGALLQRIV
jgi:hypothetical protein